MIEWLQQIDGEALLAINGLHSPFWDNFMFLASGKFIWIPLYVAILCAILLKYGWKSALIWALAAGVTVALADQLCASVLRPLFCRYRPANLLNPISSAVHIVNEYRGGRYGFPSCHAANCFAIFVLLCPVVRRREFTISLLAWALLNCYSRMYLGVHYPGDLLFGALIGATVGWLVYLATRYIVNRYKTDEPDMQPLSRPVVAFAMTAMLIVITIVALLQTYTPY